MSEVYSDAEHLHIVVTAIRLATATHDTAFQDHIATALSLEIKQAVFGLVESLPGSGTIRLNKPNRDALLHIITPLMPQEQLA